MASGAVLVALVIECAAAVSRYRQIVRFAFDNHRPIDPKGGNALGVDERFTPRHRSTNADFRGGYAPRKYQRRFAAISAGVATTKPM